MSDTGKTLQAVLYYLVENALMKKQDGGKEG